MYMSKLYIFMNLHAIEEGKVLFFSDIFSETDIGLKQVSGQAGSSLFRCSAISIRLCLLIFVF